MKLICVCGDYATDSLWLHCYVITAIAYQKAKETGFKFHWTLNGNVFVRKSEDDKPIFIKNVHDLALIK